MIIIENKTSGWSLIVNEGMKKNINSKTIKTLTYMVTVKCVEFIH
jgi:hypothetical protein